MAIKDTVCYFVACDICGAPWEGESGPYHFDSEANASSAFMGDLGEPEWVVVGVDGMYCGNCRGKRCWVCAGCGEWFPNSNPSTAFDGDTWCPPCLEAEAAGDGSDG